MNFLYSRYRSSIAMLVLCVAMQAVPSLSKAQESIPVNTRNFLNNVVDIGLSDFGLITGEDSTAIYFIAVRHTSNERNSPAEGVANSIKQVKFYNGAFRAKATKVSTTPFGAFTIVLYQSPRPPQRKWQGDFYHSLEYKRGQLSTFRDKWISDKIWSIHNAKINVVKTPKGGLVTLKVPKDAGIAKGMPLINSDGFVAGIMAESSLGKSSVRAIDMAAIANALYATGADCRYFNMVEWGKTDTRCVLELKAKEAAAEKARLAALGKTKEMLEQEAKKLEQEKRDSAAAAAKADRKITPKRHFLDYGINANFLGGPLQVKEAIKDNYFRTRAIHAGISLYLNVDKKGYNRITLKPRYGQFYERNDPGLWTSPDESVRIVTSSYQYVEMPVVLERKLLQAKKYSMAIGLGYSGGYVFSQDYSWTDKNSDADNSVKIKGDKAAIIHRLLGELYLYESKIGRLGVIYAKDLSAYPNAGYQLDVAGTTYTPFENRNKAWYLGLELQIRLRGKW